MTEDYAIILAPYWEKAGSNNIFAAQIHHYNQKGWQCVVVFTNDFMTRASLERVANSELVADKKADLFIPKWQRYLRFLISTRILKNDRYGPVHRNFMNKIGELDDDLRNFVRGKKLREICVNWFDYVDVAVRIREVVQAPDAPIVVHTHDVLARHTYTRRGKPIDISQFEIETLKKADRLVHVATDDADYFRLRVNKPQATSFITLAPNLEGSIGMLKHRPIPRSVVYVGSWNYSNPAGVEWFFRQVMPYMKKDITFFFAGAICDFLNSYYDHNVRVPNVHLLHRVDDLVDLYQNMQMVILPDLGQTGASVKLVETLAMGLPFAATSRALRGAPDEVHAALSTYIADKPRDFADKIDEILSNPIQVDGQALYWKYFSNNVWSARVDHMDRKRSEAISRGCE
jgi:glycosyltransferase involved in cell wall biosynthesis